MVVDEKQLKSKPKKIGEFEGEPVMQAETKGGFFIIMTKSAGRVRTLGAGPHPGVARHIAERDFPKLKVTELSKSESLDPAELRAELPAAIALTRRLQGVK